VTESDVREQVRQRYAAAAVAVTNGDGNPLALLDADQCCSPTSAADATASCCGGGTEVDPAFGASLYAAGEHGELPAEAVAASLGCGNPTAVADLRTGETVLDLGSGGGIDVLLSARRVGPTGFAYGVDMTEEMLALANANKTRAGLTNVAFLKGTIEQIPLPSESVDVVISNCVINLSTDKPAVLAEMFRVLKPGGRIGVSDVIAEDHLTPSERAERGSYVGCIAGALSTSEYLTGLAAVGSTDTDVAFTHEAAPGMHSAIVHAVKPLSGCTPPGIDCCGPGEQATCCEPSAKAGCCDIPAHAAGRLPMSDLVSGRPAASDEAPFLGPCVLFVCVHNAGRSQMAAGWLTHLAGDRIAVRSAGSEPADQINPLAVEAMREVGIDITGAQPKLLSTEAVAQADIVVTMGCGDACPYYPAKRYEDWDLTDPAGQSLEIVREVRDDIEQRITRLVGELISTR
jgi:arsenite methyltransferase